LSGSTMRQVRCESRATALAAALADSDGAVQFRPIRGGVEPATAGVRARAHRVLPDGRRDRDVAPLGDDFDCAYAVCLRRLTGHQPGGAPPRAVRGAAERPVRAA